MVRGLRSGALLPYWLGVGALMIGPAMAMPLAAHLRGEHTVTPGLLLLVVLGVLARRSTRVILSADAGSGPAYDGAERGVEGRRNTNQTCARP